MLKLIPELNIFFCDGCNYGVKLPEKLIPDGSLVCDDCGRVHWEYHALAHPNRIVRLTKLREYGGKL